MWRAVDFKLLVFKSGSSAGTLGTYIDSASAFCQMNFAMLAGNWPIPYFSDVRFFWFKYSVSVVSGADDVFTALKYTAVPIDCHYFPGPQHEDIFALDKLPTCLLAGLPTANCLQW